MERKLRRAENRLIKNAKEFSSGTVAVSRESLKKVTNLLRHRILKTALLKELQSKKPTSSEEVRRRHAFRLFRRRLVQYQDCRDIKYLLQDLGQITDATEYFLQTQLRENWDSPTGRRFTEEEKLFSLAIYRQSPLCYTFLRRFFVLPRPETLRKTLAAFQLKAGINKVIFDNLKLFEERNKYFYPWNRECVLLFDKMRIKSGLMYNIASDEVSGFEDFGWKKQAVLVDHVLVFMVRGLTSNYRKWKQPIAFMFCSGIVKPRVLVRCIKEVVGEVFKAGLNVVATVSDQSVSVTRAINQLKDESRKEFERSGNIYQSEGYYINGKEIFHVYDPPNLLKSFRNQLVTKDLQFTVNNMTFFARWRDFVDFYKYCNQPHLVPRCPKLTPNHIVPGKIPKAKVKHCVELFSRTVSIGMGNLIIEVSAEVHKLSFSAGGTAKLCWFLNSLFDTFNGREKDEENPFKNFVSKTSLHFEFWSEAEFILKSMIFTDEKGRTSIPNCITNWLSNIYTMRALFKKLTSRGFRELYPNRLNLDPLQNFFARIRTHDEFKINPTSDAFLKSFKVLLLQNIIGSHPPLSNCEDDGDELLTLLKTESKFTRPSPECIIDSEKYTLTYPNDNIDYPALSNVSKFIAKKLLRLHRLCQSCQTLITSMRAQRPDQVTKPTDAMTDLYRRISRIILTILPDVCHLSGVRKSLKQLITQNTDTDISFLNCGVHDLSSPFLETCLKFVIFFWCKKVNREYLMVKKVKVSKSFNR